MRNPFKHNELPSQAKKCSVRLICRAQGETRRTALRWGIAGRAQAADYMSRIALSTIA